MDFPEDDDEYSIYMGGLIYRRLERMPLTEEEEAALALWLNRNPVGLTLLERLKDRRAVAEELRRINREYDSQEAVSVIISRLRLAPAIQDKGRLVPLRRRIRMVSAAAVILLLVAGYWIFTLHHRELSTDVIESGKRNAVLTLDDGRRIGLDSARNGQLAKQAGRGVQKMNGQVIYSGGGARTGDDSVDGPITYNTMSTPRGGIYTILLPDGTKVWLNAASSIRYPTRMSGATRTVELSGEAYFDVAKNHGSPFVVRTGKMDITVLGTEFDVMAYRDEEAQRATLVTGRVMIRRGTNRQVLEPGQQANVAYEGVIGLEEHADVERAIAWKTGFFKFNDTDIRAIMREVSRWYDVDVKYETTDYSGSFGGRISRNLSLQALILLLEGNGIYHYRLEGRTLTVLP